MKKVNFDVNPKVHLMIFWKYAYIAARKGPWETYALDRFRFKCRIEKTATILDPILQEKYRMYIWETRFNK